MTPPALPSTPSGDGGRAWAKRHPKAKRLMISADGGGSNGYFYCVIIDLRV
jgi:hypothetical protein